MYLASAPVQNTVLHFPRCVWLEGRRRTLQRIGHHRRGSPYRKTTPSNICYTGCKWDGCVGTHETKKKKKVLCLRKNSSQHQYRNHHSAAQFAAITPHQTIYPLVQQSLNYICTRPCWRRSRERGATPLNHHLQHNRLGAFFHWIRLASLYGAHCRDS
jgi:hypothetical protein